MTSSWTSGNSANRLRRRLASRQPSPAPRNEARRMKFEKYASRRTYAGIQRISAISRNRTRKEDRNSIGHRLWPYFEEPEVPSGGLVHRRLLESVQRLSPMNA